MRLSYKKVSYPINWGCTNCRKIGTDRIPEGVIAEEYFRLGPMSILF